MTTADTTSSPKTDTPRADAPAEGGFWTPEWYRLFTADTGDDERTALLERASSDLADRIAAGRVDLADLDVVLDRVAEGPVGPTTWEDVDRALRIALGPNAGQLVAWITDVPARLDELDAVAHPAAGAFMRRLFVRHVGTLTQAWQSWRELPKDWKVVIRQVEWDLIDQRWVITFTFHHYDGGQSVVQAPANGLMRLTNYFLSTIPLVVDPTNYSEEAVLDLTRVMSEVSEFFSAGADAETPDGDSDQVADFSPPPAPSP